MAATCPPGAEVPATNPELLDHISQNSAGKPLQRGVTVAAVYGTTRVYELWTTCPRMQGWVRGCLPAPALDYMFSLWFSLSGIPEKVSGSLAVLLCRLQKSVDSVH